MQNKVPSTEPPRDDSMAARAVERSLRGARENAAGEVSRLVEAALGLIQQTGELEPRVSEIVKRAGVHNQAFYRHFRSKHELLVAVLDHGVIILASYLRHRMSQAGQDAGQGAGEAAGADGEPQVRAWISGVLEQARNPEAAEATRPFVFGRARLAETYPAEVARSEEQLTGLLRDAIRRAQQSGRFPGADPERDAQAIYLLTMGFIGRLMQGESPPSGADADHLVAFAMAALER